MRTLAERPAALFDPVTRALAAGSFRDGIPPVDPGATGKGALFQIKHHKRWIYAAVAADELFLGVAVVRLGYVANCFAFAFDRAAGRMVGRYSAVAPPVAASVAPVGGEGCSAWFRWLGVHVCFERRPGARDYRLEIDVPDLQVSARLSTAGMPPCIGAVAPLSGPPEGLFNATEKGVLLGTVGEAIVAGKHHDLDGGLGGYDFTSGLLKRHTAWRWAFALGRAGSAEKVAFNLVQGFVGEPECAVWVDGEIFPVSEGRVDLVAGQPLSPWSVRTVGGEVDLEFTPGDVHAEEKNFGLVKSHFLQPAGSYSGTIRLPGREPLVLDRVLGVAENQDVLW